MHGRNLFPRALPELRETVLEFISVMTELGHVLTSAIAMSLGLDPLWFRDRYTREPLILFRIFHYPPVTPDDDAWSAISVTCSIA